NGVGSTGQEEKKGRELGGWAREEKWEKGVEGEDDSVSRQPQEDEVVGDERESTNQDLGINPPLCQNTGCFCHFPVVAPQHSQQQQQRQEVQTSTEEDEDAIVPQDHVDEVAEGGTGDDEDNDEAFTIILESSPRSLSSSFSSSSSRGDGRPGTLTPAEGSEISPSEWEMGSSAFDSDSEPDGLDDEIHV
ncbi:hypothetical protein KC352_g13125, partial [Hortaea werneckii]